MTEWVAWNKIVYFTHIWGWKPETQLSVWQASLQRLGGRPASLLFQLLWCQHLLAFFGLWLPHSNLWLRLHVAFFPACVSNHPFPPLRRIFFKLSLYWFIWLHCRSGILTPPPESESLPPALEDGVLTTGPPEKSPKRIFTIGFRPLS